MTAQLTFYLSQILGKRFVSPVNNIKGVIKDIYINPAPERPKVIAIKAKIEGEIKHLDFTKFELSKKGNRLIIKCNNVKEYNLTDADIPIAEKILDRQIVDLNGRKLVRVNDVRFVSITTGAYLIAVDVGIEGLLRRLGIVDPIDSLISVFRLDLPSKFILWEDVETVDFSNASIRLTKVASKLHTLHPSDIADIIEELDKTTKHFCFCIT